MRRLKQVKRKMVRAEGLRQMAGTHFTHTEKRSIYIYISIYTYISISIYIYEEKSKFWQVNGISN